MIKVLDEADRMLDMGFEQIVRSILGQTCSVRQMVMFSATWPLAVHHLAQEFMDPNPVKVVVGSEDLSANHDVMQIVEVLDERLRDKRLLALLEKYHKSQKNRVLVFVLCKWESSIGFCLLEKYHKSQKNRVLVFVLLGGLGGAPVNQVGPPPAAYGNQAAMGYGNQPGLQPQYQNPQLGQSGGARPHPGPGGAPYMGH